MRWFLAGLLIAHGWVHLNVWGTRMAPARVSKVSRSWLVGEREGLVNLLRVSAMLLFVVAGVALAFGAGWWGVAVVAAASVSLLLVALFPIPNFWVMAPVLIDVALLVGVLGFSWPDLAVFGE